MVRRFTSPLPARAGSTVLAATVMLLSGAAATAQSPSPGFSADPCAAFRAEPTSAGWSAPGRATRVDAQAILQAEATDPYRCRLPAWADGPAWSGGGRLDLENAFHWSDPSGESVEAQAEIVGVGWAPLTLNKGQAAKLARSKTFLTQGSPGKVLKAGDYLLVQVETAETPARADARNLSFHLGTDRKGDPSNNVPTSTADPDSAYQDLQDVYTVYLAAGRAPALYSTDFAGKAGPTGSAWYNAKTPFAARIISDPPGVQFLVPAKGMGASFRPISFSDAEPAASTSGLLAVAGGGDGAAPRTFDQGSEAPVIPSGADFARLGTRLGLFPVGGVADAMVGCVNADVLHQPVELRSLKLDGADRPETTLPSGTPLVWCTWPTFEDGDVLAQWFNFADADGSRETTVLGTLTVVEGRWDQQAGRTITRELQQGVQLKVTLRGGNLYMGVVVGLGAYGYHDLTRIALESTGNEAVDRILQRSADAALAVLTPWSVDETEGRVAGDPICFPEGGTGWLSTPR